MCCDRKITEKRKTSMKELKKMSYNELKKRCTEQYTKEEMQDSIKVSEEQIKNGQCVAYDENFIDGLKKRHRV